LYYGKQKQPAVDQYRRSEFIASVEAGTDTELATRIGRAYNPIPQSIAREDLPITEPLIGIVDLCPQCIACTRTQYHLSRCDGGVVWALGPKHRDETYGGDQEYGNLLHVQDEIRILSNALILALLFFILFALFASIRFASIRYQ
jgi:hypothetical protein